METRKLCNFSFVMWPFLNVVRKSSLITVFHLFPAVKRNLWSHEVKALELQHSNDGEGDLVCIHRFQSILVSWVHFQPGLAQLSLNCVSAQISRSVSHRKCRRGIGEEMNELAWCCSFTRPASAAGQLQVSWPPLVKWLPDEYVEETWLMKGRGLMGSRTYVQCI